jgi:fructose/tagatose bisphosphate aldolase
MDMNGQSNDRLDRVEAMIAELAVNDRRLQERQEAFQEGQMKLGERVDALAQSVELLVAMHRDHEAEMKDLFNRLGNIVIVHEQRLDDLEQR